MSHSEVPRRACQPQASPHPQLAPGGCRFPSTRLPRHGDRCNEKWNANSGTKVASSGLRPRGVLADRRMANGRGEADEVLLLEPPGHCIPEGTYPACEASLVGRALLQGTQEQTQTRQLRGAFVARLASLRHAHDAGVPLPWGTAKEAPKKGNRGVSVLRVSQFLQSLLLCFSHHCLICNRPIDDERVRVDTN